MKICENESTPTNDEPIPGHLYKRTNGQYKNQVHICTDGNTLYYLKDGGPYSTGQGFSTPGPGGWEDVTDQYCLKRVEP